jgi:hypothetical protein
VLGDETQPADSDGATRGPRHAAPRKSLLTKLHVPAGKAVALAAMPTAVLMGMGFTPHLANADEMPKGSSIKPGPCVTQSDNPTPSADSTAGADSKTDKKTDQGKTGSTGKDGSKAEDGAGSPDPTTSPSAPDPGATQAPDAGKAAKPPSGGTSTQDTSSGDNKPATSTAKKSTPAATPTPSATPSPTASTNPWDPLGLGNLLGGLLGGGKSTPTSTPTPAPTTQAPAPPAGTAPTPTTSQPPATSTKSTGSTAPSTGSTKHSAPQDDAKGGTADKGSTAKDDTKAADGKGDTAKKSGKDATPTTTPTTDPATSGDAQPYPCPTYDAKALADAKVEQGIPPLPDTPWTLKTSKLTLYGLGYDGIVQVKTHNGTVKDVLKFTATGIDIENLHQIVDAPNDTKTNVQAASGSTSTIRDGTVTLYTESLSGNLLGLVPVTFTPKAPPPLTLPVLFFTNATVIQAGQFGGTLHVPGMHIFGSAS